MTLPRQEVEALFLTASRIEVPAETARELARVYLAWLDAPSFEMPSRRGPAFDWPTLTIPSGWAEKHGIDGRRVRLVVEE